MEIQSKVKGELDSETFAYHPKITARLKQSLEQEKRKLETCLPGDVEKIQAMVGALRLMIDLPEKILYEERYKRGLEAVPQR